MLHRHEETTGEVERLGALGWFIRDGFLGESLAKAVCQQARTVLLRRAGVRRSHEVDDSTRTDELAWVDRSTGGALALAFDHFVELMQTMNETAFLGLRRFDLQLARFPPGAHYVRHRDAFPGQDNRRLTAIVYLNEAWVEASGGDLLLHVEPPRQVAPVLDRLVVFRSELVEHEVLETRAERWALTAWFSARE
jgi:SM-20-related protein